MPSTTGWNGSFAGLRELLTVFANQMRSWCADEEHCLDVTSSPVLCRLKMKL